MQIPYYKIAQFLAVSCALIFFSALAYSQSAGAVTVVSVVDVTGDGSAHKLQSSAVTARWVQIICSTSNVSAVRLGSSTVSSTQGAPLAAGGGFMLPPIAPAPGTKNADVYYDLSTIYYYAAAGDKFSMILGK